ncbi:hypothetical protein LSH36_88g03007 [Paralvinella palmiformis]|uniref:Uncharacterized protein n=1 Tax=Paralvinella palmiformis TaxID=53620 RepID=A0AAD9K110_9ANNE|nr:hypothetical protein LSH36_88g03007 [Paralvinella palmiformis]
MTLNVIILSVLPNALIRDSPCHVTGTDPCVVVIETYFSKSHLSTPYSLSTIPRPDYPHPSKTNERNSPQPDVVIPECHINTCLNYLDNNWMFNSIPQSGSTNPHPRRLTGRDTALALFWHIRSGLSRRDYVNGLLCRRLKCRRSGIGDAPLGLYEFDDFGSFFIGTCPRRLVTAGIAGHNLDT